MFLISEWKNQSPLLLTILLEKIKKKNPPIAGDNYNGWVSKYREIKFPSTILKIIFPI